MVYPQTWPLCLCLLTFRIHDTPSLQTGTRDIASFQNQIDSLNTDTHIGLDEYINLLIHTRKTFIHTRMHLIIIFVFWFCDISVTKHID